MTVPLSSKLDFLRKGRWLILLVAFALGACGESAPPGTPATESVELLGSGISLPADTEAAELFEQGLLSLRRLDAVVARQAFSGALEIEPSHIPTRVFLSEALSRLGYAKTALEVIEASRQRVESLSESDRWMLEGRYHQAVRDWPEATKAYSHLFETHPESTDFGFSLCWAQAHARDFEAAIATIDRLRSLSARLAEDPRIDICEARMRLFEKKLKESLEAAVNGREKSRRGEADLLLAEARLGELVARKRLGDLTSQEYMLAADEACRIFENSGHPLGRSLALDYAAQGHFARGNLNAAYGRFQEVLAVKRDLGQNAASVLQSLGVIEKERGYPERAEKYYQEGFDQSGHPALMLNLGNLAQEQGNLNLALDFQQQALKGFEEFGNTHDAKLSLGNLAEIYAFQGSLDQALDLYDQVVMHFRVAEDKTLVAFHRYQAAHALKMRGDLFLARRELHGARDTQLRLSALTEHAKTQLELAELALAEGNASLAETLALQAEEILLIEGLADLAGYAQTLLADAQLAQGKLQAARAISAQALRKAESSKNFRLRFAAAVLDAEIRAGDGDVTALRDLESVAGEAEEMGLLRWVFEARLAAGEIEARSGAVISARKRLARLAEEAEQQGFGRISSAARAALGALEGSAS